MFSPIPIVVICDARYGGDRVKLREIDYCQYGENCSCLAPELDDIVGCSRPAVTIRSNSADQIVSALLFSSSYW